MYLAGQRPATARSAWADTSKRTHTRSPSNSANTQNLILSRTKRAQTCGTFQSNYLARVCDSLRLIANGPTSARDFLAKIGVAHNVIRRMRAFVCASVDDCRRII